MTQKWNNYQASIGEARDGETSSQTDVPNVSGSEDLVDLSCVYAVLSGETLRQHSSKAGSLQLLQSRKKHQRCTSLPISTGIVPLGKTNLQPSGHRRVNSNSLRNTNSSVQPLSETTKSSDPPKTFEILGLELLLSRHILLLISDAESVTACDERTYDSIKSTKKKKRRAEESLVSIVTLCTHQT